MRQVEASAQIAARGDEVFTFLADPANLPSWMSGIVSAEQTSPGPIGVGTTARVVRELMGQRVTADLTVTTYEPGRRLALTSTVSGIRADASLNLDPRREMTQVQFRMQLRAANVFMTPIEGVVADVAKRDVEDSLARLSTVFAER